MKIIGFNFGPLFKQYAIVIIANLTFFQFGVTVGWMSPGVVKLRDMNQTSLPEPITDTEAAWFLSISSIVALTAFFYIGYLANHVGRKYSIIITVIPRIVACLLMLFGSRVWMFLLGRAFCGMSDLFVISIIATYASEIASNTIRGGLGTVSQICSAVGSMIMLSIGPFVSLFVLNMIQTCTIVITSIPLLFLPESPYFLYTKGKEEDAVKILTYLRGDNLKAREELKEYSMNKVEKIPWKELLKDRVFLKTIGIVLFLAISSQMTGYNAVTFYLQIIFESTGTSVAPEISSVIIGCIQVLACICTILLTDKFGRKPVLVTTFFLSAVGMVGLGAFFKVKADGMEITGFLNYLPLISMIIVIFCFNAGIGALVWILMAELFDSSSRAFGVSTGAFIATAFTFLTIRYFSSLTVAIGPAATYWMFSCCCLLSCLFIGFLVPETKGKTFNQIQWDLGRR